MPAEKPVPVQSEASEASRTMTVVELKSHIPEFDDPKRGIRFYPRNGIYSPIPFWQLLEYADGSPEMVVTIDPENSLVRVVLSKSYTGKDPPTLLVARPDAEATLVTGADLVDLPRNMTTIAYSERKGDFSFENINAQVSSLVRSRQLFHSWQYLITSAFANKERGPRPKGLNQSRRDLVSDIFTNQSEQERKRTIAVMRKIFGTNVGLISDYVRGEIEQQAPNYPRRSVLMRQTMLTTALFVAEIPYLERQYAPALASKTALAETSIYLRRYALILLSDLVARDLEGNSFGYRVLDRRHAALYRDYAKGTSVRVMMDRLGLKDMALERFNLVFGQLALRSGSRRFDFSTTKEAFSAEEIMTKIDLFCDQIINFQASAIGHPNRSTRLSGALNFVSSWRALSEAKRAEVIELYIRGDFHSMRGVIGYRIATLRGFFNSLDLFTLDDISTEEIFDPSHPEYRRLAFGGFKNIEEVIDEFSRTRAIIRESSFLRHILPKEARRTLHFIDTFITIINHIGTPVMRARSRMDPMTIDYLMEMTGLSRTLVQRHFVKASMLCDYIARLKLESERTRWDSPIAKAFTLMSLADYIEAQAKK